MVNKRVFKSEEILQGKEIRQSRKMVKMKGTQILSDSSGKQSRKMVKHRVLIFESGTRIAVRFPAKVGYLTKHSKSCSGFLTRVFSLGR